MAARKSISRPNQSEADILRASYNHYIRSPLMILGGHIEGLLTRCDPHNDPVQYESLMAMHNAFKTATKSMNRLEQEGLPTKTYLNGHEGLIYDLDTERAEAQE